MKKQRDQQIGEAFRKLREEEIDSARPFAVPSDREQTGRMLSVFRPAVIVSMIMFAIVIGLVFVPSVDRTHDREVPEIVTLDLEVATSRMPTDFLLETPGTDLMTSTPHFMLSTPTFDNQEGTVR